MNASTLQPVARKIVAAVQRVLPARHALAIGLAGTVAALGMAIVTPVVQAQSSSTVEVKDWDVYVDLPTRFAFVKTPTRWVFVRQLDEEQMTRLPPGTLTDLLKVDDSEIRYAHPALEPSPRVQALRAAETLQARSAAEGPVAGAAIVPRILSVGLIVLVFGALGSPSAAPAAGRSRGGLGMAHLARHGLRSLSRRVVFGVIGPVDRRIRTNPESRGLPACRARRRAGPRDAGLPRQPARSARHRRHLSLLQGASRWRDQGR